MNNDNEVNLKYNLCCENDKIEFSFLKHSPQLLSHLLFEHNATYIKSFQSQLRIYNMIFTFTSLGVKVG